MGTERIQALTSRVKTQTHQLLIGASKARAIAITEHFREQTFRYSYNWITAFQTIEYKINISSQICKQLSLLAIRAVLM